MSEHIERSIRVESSRIRFLESWARNLRIQNDEELKHAVEVFSQARFGVSRQTAREYAREVLRLLTRGRIERAKNVSRNERRMYRRSLNPSFKLKKGRIATLRMDVLEYRKLKDVAKKRRISVSALMRYLVRELIKKDVLHHSTS